MITLPKRHGLLQTLVEERDERLGRLQEDEEEEEEAAEAGGSDEGNE